MCVESCLATVTLRGLFSLDLHVYTVNQTRNMASNTPSRANSQKPTASTPRTDTQRQSLNTTRYDPNRRSFNTTSRADPNRRSFNITRTDPKRRSLNTTRTDPKRRSLNTPRTDPNRRSFNTSRTEPNRRSLNTARTDPNRRSFNTRTDHNRRSFNTQPIAHRQSYKSHQPTEVPITTTTEEGQEAGGMGVLTPKWVVRLSASLAILGGAFLFSSVSVLTNSFGQSTRGGDGPDKTTGIIFMTIGGVSLVVSLGLGYFGCRKRKKKDDDNGSDSGRPLNFAPALSTTADMFPWPSTPSHQQPSGSPYSTPAAGQPPSFPSPFGGESSRSSNPSGEPQVPHCSQGRGGHTQKASPQGPQKQTELPVVSLPRPASPDPGPSHAS
ncbi:uncharacterized protein LOC121877064 isoform X4 [Homarus americanus]|uniref:uncharacterized protein LOC121877064 isoform X4 n=1 Tax=Homarus americanus TaxID=6706 RepID=UPI001C451743|nr:uncharacterized protein LOC121877064 isoform X4 [Homarus americanus]